MKHWKKHWKKPKRTKKANKSSTNPNTPDVIAYYTKLMEELPEELGNRDVLVLKYKEYTDTTCRISKEEELAMSELCPMCKKMGKVETHRRLCQYVIDEINWQTCCQECKEIDDSHWKQEWTDYYNSQGLGGGI